jgi:COP9 signalosome complex subunit 6
MSTVKDVYKQPQLDLVGWFALGSPTGPQPHLLPIQNRISELYTESPLLVLFHPSDALSEATTAGKLPLTIYEPVYESASGPNDKAMDIDGVSQPKELKFRELVYSVETAEAEMIAVDFVATGGGNATAVEDKSKAPKKAEEESRSRKGKGKQKAESYTADIDVSKVLTAEDDERRLADPDSLKPGLTDEKYSPISQQRSTL